MGAGSTPHRATPGRAAAPSGPGGAAAPSTRTTVLPVSGARAFRLSFPSVQGADLPNARHPCGALTGEAREPPNPTCPSAQSKGRLAALGTCRPRALTGPPHSGEQGWNTENPEPLQHRQVSMGMEPQGLRPPASTRADGADLRPRLAPTDVPVPPAIHDTSGGHQVSQTSFTGSNLPTRHIKVT